MSRRMGASKAFSVCKPSNTYLSQTPKPFMKYLFTACCLLVYGLSFAQSAKNLSLTAHMTFPATLNDIWAYEAPDGTEYALVGRTDGVSIVDLSDPASPLERHFIPGPNSTWRDLKTHGSYAYVSNETGEGILIIDLSALPASISFRDTVIAGVSTIHNLWAADSFLYAAGIGPGYTGGIMMLDLRNDPWQPQLAGIYDTRYVHDVYTRGNLAYAGEINDGLLTILDITDKSTATELGSRSYINSFTHNTWLNDAGDVCFTTDELNAAYIYAWDVSDPTDIRQLDRIRSSLSNGTAVPHNVHVLNDYLVTSYYKDGIQIVDASRPTNLVEVGYYDTNPATGGSTNGCWGAYPFLTSGLVLATDMTEGLFVLQPNYQRGCYLEGKVTDATSTLPLSGVQITISATNLSEATATTGDYAIGVADAGSYTVLYEKFGYLPETRTVSLSNGALVLQDVALSAAPTSSFDILVLDAQTNQPIEGAQVLAYPPGETPTFSYATNPAGIANDPAIIQSTYSIIAGKWGYVTKEVNIAVSGSVPSVSISLEPGIYDDFTFDYGWQVIGNATDGSWVRGEPVGTTVQGFFPANPDADITTDIWRNAWVTGNDGGFFIDDDLDGGVSVLLSPPFDLSTYTDPLLKFSWWLVNFQGGSGNNTNDDFVFELSNNGSSFVEVARFNNAFNYVWSAEEIRILDFLTPSQTMFMRVTISDETPDDVVEAAFDGFAVVEGANTAIGNALSTSQFRLYPVPVQEQLTIEYDLPGTATDLQFELYDLRGARLATYPLPDHSTTHTIDFPHPKGIYMGVLSQGKQVLAVQKLMK